MQSVLEKKDEVQGLPPLPAPPVVKKDRKGALKWGAIGLGIVVVLGISGAVAQGDQGVTKPIAQSNPEFVQPGTGAHLEPGEALPESQSIEEPVEVDAPEITEPEFTVIQENAIGTAESYLDSMAFSKSGLIEQLEFEKYSAADARFAVNHITVDWNEQAAKSAKSYLESMSFSRQGLIDQLEFEGFTTQQATHGVNTTGL